ncbi:MAG: N-acetyltransferase [Saprospiraceae bacterium]|nr:N-acetyltransferase [Saprospiraceae bacterium]
MDLEIRMATESDVPAILPIINYEIANSTAIYDYEPRTFEMQMDWFKKKIEDKMPVIIGVSEAKVIGFATYGIFRPKIAYRFSVEHSIYLAPDTRGKGAGKQLMGTLIDKAQQAGFHTMIAGVDASNQTSYFFHKKLGFVEVARFKEVGYKFDKWLDLVFMQLFLD